MHAVVVIESCFGNTSKVADAIIVGLRSSGAEVDTYAAGSAPRPRTPTSTGCRIIGR